MRSPLEIRFVVQFKSVAKKTRLQTFFTWASADHEIQSDLEEAAVAAGKVKIIKEVEAALLAAQPKVVRDTYRPTEGDWQPKV